MVKEKNQSKTIIKRKKKMLRLDQLYKGLFKIRKQKPRSYASNNETINKDYHLKSKLLP